MEKEYESILNLKLQNNVIYKELQKKCSQSEQYTPVIALIQEVGVYALSKLKTVIKNMPEFTLHDEEHVFNMLFIIGKLVPKATLEYMSIPDLMMTILVVFLHDIGMAPEEGYIKAWKGQINEMGGMFQEENEKFKRFRMTYTQQLEEIELLNIAKEYAKAQLLEDYIVTEYIRSTHSDRARAIIAKDWAGKIKYLDTDLTAELAEICFSHNEDYTYLLNIETMKLCGVDTYLCVPFVAVLLRLADIIDFDSKRTPSVLFSHLTVKNPVSLAEWRKHQAVNAWSISSKHLIFSAQCKHPAIEATIHKFCNLIDNELRNCTLVLSNLNSSYAEEEFLKYKIPLPARVDRSKIAAKKDIATGKPIYKYHDTKFTLSKKQVIDLLMGTKLYGKPDVALRELIQNSIDACLLREKLSEKWGDSYLPKITISFYTENNIDYLRVKDNGIGMNQYIIDNYYTNIGNSYYRSREFYELMAEMNSSFQPISRFGIGILACFMVCDTLEVTTRRVTGRYMCDEALKIVVEGYDSLFTITESDKDEPGTDTILQLRKVNPWNRMNTNQFTNSIKNLVPRPPFEFDIITRENQEVHSSEAFEEMDLEPIQDYTWKDEEHVETIEINLTCEKYGFRGLACVGYIVRNGMPAKEVNLQSKEVLIEGDTYTLSVNICYGKNCITKEADSIEVGEEGEIEAHTGSREITKSRAALSMHGIEVPCKLFHDYTNYGEKAVLDFPFPITFRLDISGSNDLNLNSARTQIIYDDKWLNFEENLFSVICNELKHAMKSRKWSVFKGIMISRLGSKPQLLRILSEIQ